MKRLKFLKQITLTESEKEDMFARISQRTGMDQWKKLPVKSPYVFAGFFSSSHFKFAMAAVIVFILTGTAAFASKALPGDLLYPVKINVIERVPDALAWSSEAKAKRNSKKIESRIKEFEALADQGKLDERKAAAIDLKVKKSISDFDRNLNDLRESKGKSRSKLDSDLKGLIKNHKEKILDIKKSNSFTDNDVMEKVLNRADKEENEEEDEDEDQENNKKDDQDSGKTDAKKSESKSEQNSSVHKGRDIKIDLDVENERDLEDKVKEKGLL